MSIAAIGAVRRHPALEPNAGAREATIGLQSTDRPVPHSLPKHDYWPLAGLLLGSFLAHASLLGIFAQPPEPLPSIGIPAMSVEIVVGDDAPAGVAAAPGQEGAAQAKQEVTLQEPPQESVPVTRSGEQQEVVLPQDTRSQPTSEIAAASAPRHLELRATESSIVPSDRASVVPETRPVREVELTPPPAPAAEHASLQAAQPAKRDELPAPDSQPQTRASAPPWPSASGVSRGRSSSDATYHSLVAAHLARHKQFPADARRRGQQGSVSVSFNIDGGGHVTEIRLIRSAGSAILDREAQSMVKRASPFPPPPGGRPQSFSVPVSFSMR